MVLKTTGKHAPIAESGGGVHETGTVIDVAVYPSIGQPKESNNNGLLFPFLDNPEMNPL